jgi:hypothetical protein
VLIVAVHDVAASTLAQVEWLLEQLDAAGVQRRVLKVIPAERDAPAESSAALVALARREAALGSEIVLHGWTHRADGPLRGSFTDRLRARLFAGDAAEFLSTDAAEMTRRLAACRAWADAAGVEVSGFCPPAWLAAAGLPEAARAAGFRYIALLRGLRDLDRGGWVLLPPRGYMGAGAGQERMVRAAGALLSRPLAALLRSPAQRRFLHPQNADRSRDCARQLREVARLARSHETGTYRELLDAA